MAALALRANVFRAVADPTRRAMLELLRESDRSVTELLTPFPMTQPAISQHLRILREAGLVSGEKVGRRRIYRFHANRLREVYDWAARQFADPSGHVWRLSPAKRRPRSTARARGKTPPGK